MSDFTQAVNLLLRAEGGLVTDPADPGGTTNFGISARIYSNVNVESLTQDDAIAIYKRDYWHFGNVKDQRLANLLLSLSVNLGQATAIGMLQKALGIGVDGRWGHSTESAANACPDALADYAAAAIRNYFRLAVSVPANARFIGGWVKRVIVCLV